MFKLNDHERPRPFASLFTFGIQSIKVVENDVNTDGGISLLEKNIYYFKRGKLIYRDGVNKF